MHLYQQLFQQLQEQIQSGLFRPGQRLPSIRECAEQRALSRNTVIQAYERLSEQGLVESRDRTGFIVLPPRRPQAAAPGIHELMPSTPRPDHLALSVVRSAGSSGLAPLGSAHPSGEFPALQTFRRLYARQQREACREEVRLTRYEVPPGHAGLRQQLARHMARSDATVDPREIVITNGCQEALSLSLQTVVAPGGIVAVESPCFYGILQCIEVLGMRVLEIPADPLKGMRMDLLAQALERWPVQAILVNPTFNNPQGHVMPDQSAQRLVALARQHDLPIIEDDVFGDISYERRRPKSVRAWDEDGRVLLCSSLSKSLDSDLRLGWVAAGRYSEQLGYRKYVTTMASRGQIQSAAAEFLSGSRFQRHLATIARCYRARRDFTLEAIGRHFPASTQVNYPRGGFHCWVALPRGVDSFALYTQLMEEGISTAPGTLFGNNGQYEHFLRINYSCINDDHKYNNIIKKIGYKINVLCENI